MCGAGEHREQQCKRRDVLLPHFRLLWEQLKLDTQKLVIWRFGSILESRSCRRQSGVAWWGGRLMFLRPHLRLCNLTIATSTALAKTSR